jgi:microsomal dipeptidase-like Zn-dependent dipeptidase
VLARAVVALALLVAGVMAPGAADAREPSTGATGRSFSGTTRDGTVLGFADDHVHITANLRAGGRVIHGEPFDRRGVAFALGGDARDHGADGSRDVVGNLLRGGSPFGTHDTGGWPTFAGWPTHDTLTHQQTYWVWLKRAWRAGLRLVVAQTVEDDELCRVMKQRSHPCSEPVAIAQQIRVLRRLQSYVDRRSGGRGRGFFRLVYTPRQARHVIEQGRLAVVIGVESSNPFGCRLERGRPTCTARDVDRGLARYHRLGVRSLFIAHWFDNAFAGAALESGLKGAFINAMNRLETGHYLRVARCPRAGQGEQAVAAPKAAIDLIAPYFNGVSALSSVPIPAYPTGKRCNARGLTALGVHLVRRMMRLHMIIEADHLSERARDRLLRIAAAAHYPVVSGHNGTGGAWTAGELRILYRLGGIAASTLDTAPALVRKVRRLGRLAGRKVGVPLGSDVGGFASLPGPTAAGGPLHYPFRSFKGDVTFRRQRTGTRVFDLNADGVAHYGLVADLLADVQRQPGGRKALDLLFHSAEGYLRMWERTRPHAAAGIW